MNTDQLYLQSLLYDIKDHSILSFPSLLSEWQTDLSPNVIEVFKKATDLASARLFTEENQLVSIFHTLDVKHSSVSASNSELATATFYPIRKAQLNESIFPKRSKHANEEYTLLKKALMKDWEADIKRISGAETPEIRADRLLSLLYKYGSFLPSGYGQDVALYDYAKVKAAICICLHQSDEDFLLVSGGVSRIQTYLYNVVRKRAASLLKGRSFYLKILLDSVVSFLLEELSLYKCNLLYSSGGNFALIIPKSQEELLTELESKIMLNLFSQHKTELSFYMGWGRLTQEDLLQQNLSSAWESINNMIKYKKNQAFRPVLEAQTLFSQNDSTGFDYFFRPHEKGGETFEGASQRDAISGEELSDPKNLAKKGEPPVYVSALTKQQSELGDELRCHRQFCAYFEDQQQSKDLNPGYLNVFWKMGAPSILDGKRLLFQLNNFQVPVALEKKDVFQFELYGGNDSPDFRNTPKDKIPEDLRPESTKTYEWLADDGGGVNKLGILRMDVDNLGRIFQEAFDRSVFPTAQSTLCRWVSLSRQLDFFFKGWLNKIWESKEEYKEHVLILYSGGDDLFLVGKWDSVLQFAQEIRRDLKEWTAFHPGISISGGMAIVTPKFPVSKAAELSGQAEELAKSYSLGGQITKDALSLFGVPLHWEVDFPKVVELKDELLKFINRGLISKNLLSRLMALHDDRNFQLEKEMTESWRWTLAYAIHKVKSEIKKRDFDARDFMDELSTNIFANAFKGEKLVSQNDFFDLVYVAARWAELSYRHNKKMN